MNCIQCKAETVNDKVRCSTCADAHRIKVREYYYAKKHGVAPPSTEGLTKGMRSPIRDRISELLSDGVPRSAVAIAKAIDWKSATSITKTLGDIKNSLAARSDKWKLKKVKLGVSPRHGTEWQIINRHEDEQD